MRWTIVCDTRLRPRALANMFGILLRLFRIVVELEVEVVLRLLRFEARLDRDHRRQRRLRHARFEVDAAAGRSERNRGTARYDAAHERLRDERARVVVV